LEHPPRSRISIGRTGAAPHTKALITWQFDTLLRRPCDARFGVPANKKLGDQ